MKAGFVLAQPACSMAPFALPPDELGEAWRDGRICLDVEIDWNGTRFGSVNRLETDVRCPALVIHAAAARKSLAETIIDSETILSGRIPLRVLCLSAATDRASHLSRSPR